MKKRNGNHYSYKRTNHRYNNNHSYYNYLKYKTYDSIFDVMSNNNQNSVNNENDKHCSGTWTMIIIGLIIVLLFIGGKSQAEKNKRQVIENLRQQTYQSDLYKQSYSNNSLYN